MSFSLVRVGLCIYSIQQRDRAQPPQCIGATTRMRAPGPGPVPGCAAVTLLRSRCCAPVTFALGSMRTDQATSNERSQAWREIEKGKHTNGAGSYRSSRWSNEVCRSERRCGPRWPRRARLLPIGLGPSVTTGRR